MNTNLPPVTGGTTDKAGFDGVDARDTELLDDKSPAPATPAEPKIETKPEGELPPEEELEPLPEETPEELEPLPGRLDFKALKTEFPELVKKYPQLLSAYNESEKFKEVFPTIDDATLASQKAEVFDVLDSKVMGGDLSPIIDAVNGTNPNVLPKIADSILPTLYKTNPQLYIRAVNPVLKNMIGAAITQAQKMGGDNGENLKNAAMLLAQFVWGDSGVPQDPQPQREDPEKLKLEQEKQQLWMNQAYSYENDVKETTKKYLLREIENDLDPNNEMTPFTREKLIEDIALQINEALASNKVNMAEMNSLWRKAAQMGFPAEFKPSIIRAFLGRAKVLLPAIRQKRKAEALGQNVRMAQPAQTVEQQRRKTNVPPGGGSARGRSSFITAKDANKERLSDLDIINRGA